MAEANAEEAVSVRGYQPPAIIDLLRVKEPCFLSLDVGEAAIGVELLGGRRMADDDAYQQSENGGFGFHILDLMWLVRGLLPVFPRRSS